MSVIRGIRRRRSGVAAVCLLTVAFATLATASTALARILRVSASGTSCKGAKYSTIGEAVAAAKPRDTILVCPGIYDEQVVADQRLKIRGKSGAILRPTAMAANTTSLRTGDPIAAVLVLTDKSKVRGLEIDASQNGLGCEDGTLIGVYFRGAPGTLRKSTVRGTRLIGAGASCDTGAAVVVQGDGSKRVKVSLSDNDISDYQRAGIVVNEAGAEATIRNNTVTGLGSTAEVAQNGIQVAYGASASVVKNAVQGNSTPSTGTCAFDGGNLIFSANRGLISRNTFTGNTAGVYVSGSSNRILKNRMNGLLGGVPAGLDGVVIDGDTNQVLKNQIHDVSAVGIRIFGNANKVTGNTVTGTRSAKLCDAAREISGCEDLLAQCGIAVWVALGTDNVVAGNTLLDNDTDLLDEGLATKFRRSRRRR